MLSGVCARLASALRGTRAPPSAVALRCLHASSSRPSADKSERTEKPPRAFDQALLEFLVCPLSKKPLSFCKWNHQALPVVTIMHHRTFWEKEENFQSFLVWRIKWKIFEQIIPET